MAIRKTIIEVKKNSAESNANLLRRFSRRVQESGFIRKIKGHRYSERPKSKLSMKKSALVRMARRKENDRLRKLGKIT